ncbi:MAG: DUF3750 domain-containing protein [Pseudobacteriovorax sp.]|nr:DUF3750 domain-containing protein [Pseudobacteriovorax sp.]
MGISPSPSEESRAIVQVFGARTFGKRGAFAVHTWIATKEADALVYTTYEVIGWRARYGREALLVKQDIPDRRWFGSDAELIDEIRGETAERAIKRIQELVPKYPHRFEYRVWPGPNSNTFVSWVIRNTSELQVELPPHAIGRDYIVDHGLFAKSESGTGLQMSLFGLIGFTFGLYDGLEINILSLSFGVDFLRPAIKLPMLGRLGMSERSPPHKTESNSG